MADPSITVEGLAVHVGEAPILRETSFTVTEGEVLTLFGPSGAGKTTVARAVAGLTAPGVTVTGHVAAPARVGYLPQQAAETLNPARRIGRALGELVTLRHPGEQRSRRRARVAEVLRAAAFDVDGAELKRLLRRYPFEFSGGQRTRLALAQVLATGPAALVLDEPTTGLDEFGKATLIDQLAALARGGVAMVIATHDSDVLEQLSTRALRVHDGRVSAAGPPCPRPVGPATSAARSHGPAVVRLRQVSLRYGPNEVLRDVDLDLFEGETLGIVGESGAGKSSIARVIAGVAEPGSGTVTFDGKPLPALRKRSKQEIARVQYVWQEAASSFDARRTVLDQVSMTAVRLRGLPPAEARKEATELLAELELTREQFGRFPPGLSGGQLQRAAIVRALLARPRVLICDEVTTGLDQQLSGLILDRLDIYRARTGASLVSISHEPRTLAGRADRVVVVDRGRVAPPVASPVASEGGRTGEEFPRSC